MENFSGDEMESNFNQQNNQPFTYNFENQKSNQLQYQTQPISNQLQYQTQPMSNQLQYQTQHMMSNFQNTPNMGDFSHIPTPSILENINILENNSSQCSPISIS